MAMAWRRVLCRLPALSQCRSARLSSDSSAGRLWEIVTNTKKLVTKRLTPVDYGKPMGLPDTVFDFSDSAVVESWACDTDGVIGGESTATLQYDQDQHATFEGALSTAIPAGGKPTLMGESYHDWSDHNGVEVELRGDGRVYIASIYTDGMQAEDIYQAAIYTRGGPLWQKVQIPFVDFLLTSYGYVQNEQSEFNARSIRTFGVLLADQIDGEFKLDIRAIRAITMKKLVTNHEAE